MKDIDLADLTVHVDESLDAPGRMRVEQALRGLRGVISVHVGSGTPHLFVVQYNPDETGSKAILNCVKDQQVHAELIGM